MVRMLVSDLRRLRLDQPEKPVEFQYAVRAEFAAMRWFFDTFELAARPDEEAELQKARDAGVEYPLWGKVLAAAGQERWCRPPHVAHDFAPFCGTFAGSDLVDVQNVHDLPLHLSLAGAVCHCFAHDMRAPAQQAAQVARRPGALRVV